MLSGQDPSAVNTVDPLRLWIIQVGESICSQVLVHLRNNMHATGVIILTTQVLALGLRKMRQPKVIAEVIGGILLGMCVVSRVISQ